MIIAGAAEGSVGLRDHTATSFLDFSTGEVVDCFVTSGKTMIGDDPSDEGVEGTSGDCRMGSGTDTGSDTGSVTGSDTSSFTGSFTGSVIGSIVGSRAGSTTGSGAGSRTGSDICSMS